MLGSELFTGAEPCFDREENGCVEAGDGCVDAGDGCVDAGATHRDRWRARACLLGQRLRGCLAVRLTLE
jgi:hypothetical protein